MGSTELHVKTSVKILSMKKSELAPQSKVIYAFLLTLAGEGLKTTVGRKTIAKYLHIGDSTVTKYIKDLRDKKIIKVKYALNERNTYTLPPAGKNPYRLLSEFVTSEHFTFNEKAFLVSILPYVERKGGETKIMLTQSQMKEKTGLGEKFIAKQLFELSGNRDVENDVYMLKKIKGGWVIDESALLLISEREKVNLIKKVDELEFRMQRMKNGHNKNK